MSIHRPDSQLSRVNAAAGRNAVPVDDAVLDVVERACAMARRTDGVYDPTVLPLMRLYGFYDARTAATRARRRSTACSRSSTGGAS